MTQAEMIALIRDGITIKGGQWADLGAGRGNFTIALRALVGEQAIIHAIDNSARDLRHNHSATHHHRADFTRSLPVANLDGVLMANALHWVRDQKTVLHHIKEALNPTGRLIIVEYDVNTPYSFIPHPAPLTRLQHLGTSIGFKQITQIGHRRSPRTGMVMIAVQLLIG